MREDSDWKEFEFWFREKSNACRSTISFRSLLRGLPLVRTGRSTASMDEFLLNILRTSLAVGVASYCDSAVQCGDKKNEDLGRELSVFPSLALFARAVDAAFQTSQGNLLEPTATTYAANAVNSTARDEDLWFVTKAAQKDAVFLASEGEATSVETSRSLHREPVSLPRRVSQILDEDDASNRSIVRQGGSWNFWREWYDAALSGYPLSWDLQYKVATAIPDNVWEDGPEAVAKAIREIEEELNEVSALDEEKATNHAQTLVKTALKSELEARGLSDLIKMAVQAYEREISNCLPDELEPLRNLPDVLDQIALVLAGDEPTTAKERELAKLIQRMSRTINELNRRLERLQAEKKAGSPRRSFADALYTNSGAGFGKMVSSKLFWGGLIGSGLVLMGVGSEAATDKLAWMCNELILPEGSEIVQMPSAQNEGGAKFVRPPEK